MAVPLLVFISSKRTPQDHTLLDRVVLTAILPLQLGVETLFDKAASAVNYYADLRYTYEENQLLKIKLEQQRIINLMAKEEYLENKRLRKLLNFSHNPGFSHLTAEVVATGPSPYFHTITINRGLNDGVTLGAAVIVPSGIIGRVVALAPKSAEVSLLTDPNSSFDVLVQRTRSRGRAVGLGDENSFRASLDYILRTDDVALGDTVITSGLDGLFPKGLPVGTIVEIHKHHFGLHLELILEAAADFEHLEEVLILLPREAPSDPSLEAAP